MITHIDHRPLQVERVYAARHRSTPYRRNGIITKCCACGRTKIGPDRWAYVPASYIDHEPESVSHGFCANCFKTRMDKLKKKGKKMKKPYFCDKPEDHNHPRMPEHQAPIKPMPALGCTGKYFRDEIIRAHHGIDTTYEHSTSDGKGYASRCRIGKQT